MRIGRIIVHRFRSLLQRSHVESDLDSELDFHLEQLVKENIAEGMSESDAVRFARQRFGPIESTRERCRDTRGIRLLEDLGKDLLFACRGFRKSPGFTLTAILSLALAIGANTIVFSVLNALLLKPLPIRDPKRVWFINNSGGTSHSFPNYRAIRDRNTTFQSLFAYRVTQMALDNDRGAERVWGYLVTGNYFETLGVSPALGRFFTPAEDVHVNASPYAVLSYAAWQNRFGGDPSIEGKNIRINGQPFAVVGVAPRGFHGTESFYWPEIWVPMTMEPRIEGFPWLDEVHTYNSWVAGRLKTGVSVPQAEANLATIAAQLAREHPYDEGMRLTLSKLGMAGATLRDPTRAFAGGLMLLASLVLFAGCANLASLLAARAADRERDLAIRVSIGAGRGRIVRQLLTESVAISSAGGAAGLVLAVALLRALSRWRAPLQFPVQFDVNADWRVFLFAFAAAVLTGMLCATGPSRRAWKTDPAMSLKGLELRAPGRRSASRDVLLALQIALCCVLVTSSLVAVRGLMRSFTTPLGFRPDGAAVIGFDAGLGGYDRVRGDQFERRALEEIGRLPGVESASYSNSVPLSIDQSSTTAFREGTTDFRPRNAHRATYYQVYQGYFQTAGTTLLAGRDFTLQDNARSPRVAVVNRTFARTVIGTADAVGRRFLAGAGPVEVVGVVEDGKYTTLTEAAAPVVFYPILQSYNSTVVLMARSRRPEGEMAAEMRQAIARLDPHLAVYGVGGLRQMLGLAYLPMHAAVIALGAFGVLALMLSITGIYGLSAYTVSRRSREIGVRMAVGARPADVLKSVFGRTGTVVAIGSAAGLLLGVAGAGVLASLVYQASSHDPIVIGGATLLIALVAFAAAFGPARRAMRIDPMQSLRQD